MTESMSKLINDKAVCRTAPATQGLSTGHGRPNLTFFLVEVLRNAVFCVNN